MGICLYCYRNFALAALRPVCDVWLLDAAINKCTQVLAGGSRTEMLRTGSSTNSMRSGKIKL